MRRAAIVNAKVAHEIKELAELRGTLLGVRNPFAPLD